MCCLAARHSLIHPLPISQAAARRQQRAEELATRSSATSPPPRAVESSGGDAEISSSLRSFCRSLDPTSTGTVPIDVHDLFDDFARVPGGLIGVPAPVLHIPFDGNEGFITPQRAHFSPFGGLRGPANFVLKRGVTATAQTDDGAAGARIAGTLAPATVPIVRR